MIMRKREKKVYGPSNEKLALIMRCIQRIPYWKKVVFPSYTELSYWIEFWKKISTSFHCFQHSQFGLMVKKKIHNKKTTLHSKSSHFLGDCLIFWLKCHTVSWFAPTLTVHHTIFNANNSYDGCVFLLNIVGIARFGLKCWFYVNIFEVLVE